MHQRVLGRSVRLRARFRALIIKIFMSQPSVRSKSLSDSEGAAEGGGNVASTVSIDNKSSLAQPNSSNEDSAVASEGGKGPPSNSVAANDPQPSASGKEDQSDAASAASNTSQSENRKGRSRTRSASQTNNTDSQQNGDKRYQYQVSCLS